MHLAKGAYILHLDDDDCYAPDAVASVRRAISESIGSVFLFQMQYIDGRILWDRREIAFGNVGTPMIAHPREAKRGTWGSFVGGDHQFIRDTILMNPDRDLCWIPRVIALIAPADRK